MFRKVLTTAAASLAVAGVAASAQPANGAAKPRSPLAAARVAECTRGPAPESRLAVFRGAMRRVPGSYRMAMRFKLQERVGTEGFRTVRAPGLGTWHRSRPGVRRFAYRQRVVALAEGSAYRTVVSFRWYSADGELVRQTRRRSPACRQPGLLPDLRVTRIGGGRTVAGAPGAYSYTVTVLNRGSVMAENFAVSFAVDGGTVETRAVNALAPGESRILFFSGPACRGTVTAVADPDDNVREVSERENSLTQPCPNSPGGG
jgi:hypothetical protein